MQTRQQEREEARLVLRAQLGDRDSLDALLQRVQGRLLQYLNYRLISQADAEDCLQAVLITICRRLITLREPRALRPWIYRIASREASRLRRKRPQEQDQDEESWNALAEKEPEEFEWEVYLPQLPAKLATLPPNSREVLFLHYQEGLRLSEIAQVLCKPLGTIKSRLAYGLQKLRAELKPPPGTTPPGPPPLAFPAPNPPTIYPDTTLSTKEKPNHE